MNIMIELRNRHAQLVKDAEALAKLAEGEDRDFTADETRQYDAALAEAEGLRNRIGRLEKLDGANGYMEERAGGKQGRQAPAHNKTPLGDSETRALAHFVRTGDKGGVSHLVRQEEQGKSAVEIYVPTQAEMRAAVDSTMNITTDADGKYSVPTGFSGRVAMRKNEMMLAEKLGCQRVPGKGTTVNFPYENADPEEFATTAEQADNHSVSYERDSGVLGIKAFTLVKKTRKIELTEELLEDNDVNLMEYIANRIARQVAGTHNTMLITEVGSNGTSLKTFASATAIAAGEPEDIVFNDTLSYYLEDGGNVGWVMRPTTFGNIASITGSDRLYAQTPGGSFQKELLGYPVHYSNKVTATAASAKDVYFGDWFNVGYREAPEMRFIQDPYSVDGLVILKYSFRAVYGVLVAGAVGYGQHPSA